MAIDQEFRMQSNANGVIKIKKSTFRLLSVGLLLLHVVTIVLLGVLILQHADTAKLVRDQPAANDQESSKSDHQTQTTPIGNCSPTQYLLSVEVGTHTQAATDHPIFARLFGDHGSCGPVQLTTPIDNFQLGATDEFLLTCHRAVGALQQIELELKGIDGLFVIAVIVQEVGSQHYFEFPCSCWIDDQEEFGQLIRNITVARHCVSI